MNLSHAIVSTEYRVRLSWTTPCPVTSFVFVRLLLSYFRFGSSVFRPLQHEQNGFGYRTFVDQQEVGKWKHLSQNQETKKIVGFLVADSLRRPWICFADCTVTDEHQALCNQHQHFYCGTGRIFIADKRYPDVFFFFVWKSWTVVKDGGMPPISMLARERLATNNWAAQDNRNGKFQMLVRCFVQDWIEFRRVLKSNTPSGWNSFATNQAQTIWIVKFLARTKTSNRYLPFPRVPSWKRSSSNTNSCTLPSFALVCRMLHVYKGYRRVPVSSSLCSVTDLQCTLSSYDERYDCHPELFVNQSVCEARGCCWNPVTQPASSW